MTFRISRSGGFGGVGGLDPFGSGRGGLGRYNLGSDLGSIEAYEAYVIAIGWQNGSVTDADYLASLKRQWDLAPPGSKEMESAKNKYEDATYTIARNKIVNTINLAPNTASREAGLRALLAHDRAREKVMVGDNEAHREILAKIVSTEADIRQTEYGDLVEKYNRGKVTTADLIGYVKGAISGSAGAPDAADWSKTLADLVDRRNDEVVAAKQQDYQQNRDPHGMSLLETLKAQRAGLTPGSPKYDEITRRIEDVTKQVRATDLALRHATLYEKWQQGKVTDQALLKDLEAQVKEAPAGTQEEVQAKGNLISQRFSLVEDRIRDEVDRGKRPKGDLIRFYQGYLRTMVAGSYRARQIAAAIRSLKGSGSTGGGGGGGGGGGSGSKGGGLGDTRKLITLPEPWKTWVAKGKDVKGRPLPKGALDALLAFDAANTTQRSWYQNNRKGMDMAFDQGQSTWIFTAPDGKRYELEFSEDAYRQYLVAGEQSFRSWADHAKTPKEAQAAASQWWTATQRLVHYTQTITMDDYEARMSSLDRQKKTALLSNDLALYSTLVGLQANLIQTTAGLPEGQTDISLVTANLTPDQIRRIAADIDRISPRETDPNNANGDPVNTNGDPIMAAFAAGVLEYTTHEDPETHVRITDNVKLDRNRGYWTQNGPTMELVTDLDAPGQFTPTTVGLLGEPLPTPVPAYQVGLSPVVIYGATEALPAPENVFGRRIGGPVIQEDQSNPTTVWLPAAANHMAGNVYATINGSGNGVVIGPSGPAAAPPGPGAADITAYAQSQGRTPAPVNSVATKSRVLVPLPGGIPLTTITVYGWLPGGGKGFSTWVSVQPKGTADAMWLRLPQNGGTNPRVVLDPSSPWAPKDGTRFTIKNGKLAIDNGDGTSTIVTSGMDLSPYMRFYSNLDALGVADVGVGAPGVDLDWTLADHYGQLNTNRPKNRPENELHETYDPQGQLVMRTYNNQAASEQEQAAHMRRARGAAVGSQDRNIDKDAYYDNEAGRWKSGTPKRAGSLYEPYKPGPYEDPRTLTLPRAGAASRSVAPYEPPPSLIAESLRDRGPEEIVTQRGARSELIPPPPPEPIVSPTAKTTLAPRPVPKLKQLVNPRLAPTRERNIDKLERDEPKAKSKSKAKSTPVHTAPVKGSNANPDRL